MQKRVLILGGGPGGYTAAFAASALGLSPTVIEERQMGGTCLNRGCIPTKTLLNSSRLYDSLKSSRNIGITCSSPGYSMPDIIGRKNKVVNILRTGLEGLMKRRKIEVVKGRGRLLPGKKIQVGDKILESDAIIIATGSEPLKLFESPCLITSDDALDIREVPPSMLIIGAGAVGLEFACFFSELGCKVTVVEMMARVLPGGPNEISDALHRELKKKSIRILTSTRIESISDDEVTFQDGTKERFPVILQAAGRKLNTDDMGLEECGIKLDRFTIPVNEYLETNVPGIYAVGDITTGSPMLAHSAFHQGVTAVRNIAGEKIACDLSLVPFAVYTHPEAAWAGKDEGEIPENKMGKVLMRTLGRAHAQDEIEGFIKIIAGKDDKILGVQIISAHASEMIHEGVLAIKTGSTISDLADMIHAHPTFLESYGETAYGMLGIPLSSG
ncbi:MAG: dihydrolipoyl dehydrogenase [Chloroflexi bacterium]|nr:dihydrolipoyl dehydrogenase [Chloroflexota bacterium]